DVYGTGVRVDAVGHVFMRGGSDWFAEGATAWGSERGGDGDAGEVELARRGGGGDSGSAGGEGKDHGIRPCGISDERSAVADHSVVGEKIERRGGRCEPVCDGRARGGGDVAGKETVSERGFLS